MPSVTDTSLTSVGSITAANWRTCFDVKRTMIPTRRAALSRASMQNVQFGKLRHYEIAAALAVQAPAV